MKRTQGTALLLLLILGTALVSTHAMHRSGSMVTETGGLRSNAVATTSSGPSRLEVSHDHFLCTMLHLDFGSVLKGAFGLQVKVAFEYASGDTNPAKVSLSGLLGGGVTVGNTAILAASAFITREVTVTVGLPTRLRQAIGNGPNAQWGKAVKYAVEEIIHQERGGTAAGRLVEKAGKKKAKLLDRIGQVPQLIKDFGYVVPKGTDLHQILRHQLKSTLRKLSENLVVQLKDGAKSHRPGQEDHKIQVRKAYFITYVDPVIAHYKNEAGWFDKSPNCKTIHENFKNRGEHFSEGHPGIRNLLCDFMNMAYLLPDVSEAATGTLGVWTYGYRNTLNMVDIVLGAIAGADLEEVYGPEGATEADRARFIENYVESLGLGKGHSALWSPVILRAAGALLTYPKNKAETVIDMFTNQNGFRDAAYVCQDNDPNCGIVSYTTEFTYGFTLGFGGDINFCTPDTNLVQVYHMTKHVYQREIGKGVVRLPGSERTLKLLLSGTIFFQAELSFDWHWENTRLKEVKFIVRVPVIDESTAPKADQPSQDLFDEFFKRNGEKIAEALYTLFATGTAINAAAKDSSSQSARGLNSRREEFLNEIKNRNAAKRLRRRLLMDTAGSVTGQVFFQKLAAGLSEETVWNAMVPGIMQSALKQAFDRISPITTEKKHYIGGEITLTRENGVWTAAQGGLFHLGWWGLAAGVPIPALGAEFRFAGYYGTSTEANLRVV